MVKYILFFFLMFTGTAYCAQYQCDAVREKYQNRYHSNKVYSKGIINDDGKTIGFKMFDNNDKYTSGKLFEMKDNNFDNLYYKKFR